MSDKNIVVLKENDFNLDFEIEDGTRKYVNLVLIPILNSLPASLRPYITKDKAADEVVKYRTSHYALDTVYQKGYNIYKPKKILEKLARKVWFNTNNAKAVRNRLKLVTYLIKKEAENVVKKKGKVKILSIAAGSARAVLDTVEHISQKDNVQVEALFMDKKESALEYSQNIAKEKSLLDRKNIKLSWIQGTAGTFLENLTEDFDIIEMVGLLDYFDDEKSLEIFKKVRERLTDELSAFVTANITPNKEEPFMSKFVDWRMTYRTPEQLKSLIENSGFSSCTVYHEPLKTHAVALAKK